MALYITGEKAVDGLINKDAFALLVGMILDQQVPMERAFSSPAALRERLGGKLDPTLITEIEPDRLVSIFSEKPALHRFPASMAERVQKAAQIIVDEYSGKTDRIWKSAKTGEELFSNLRKLPGFGEQKARIFIAILGKQIGVQPPGWEKVAGPYGKKGTFVSVADIDSLDALQRVRTHKGEMKKAAKSALPAKASTTTRRS